MQTAKLEDMTKGWFVGNFSPTLYRTNDVEAAVKKYHANDSEEAHYHKIATEITVVVSGTIRLNEKDYHAGDIVVIEAGDVARFLAVTDAVTTVIKIPGANHDKYLVEEG